MRAMRGVLAVRAVLAVVAVVWGAAGSAAVASPADPLDWTTSTGTPSDDWRTLDVPGYRIYFPAPAEPWARHLAARLPAVRERVAASVGSDPHGTVDVVLADPIARAQRRRLAAARAIRARCCCSRRPERRRRSPSSSTGPSCSSSTSRRTSRTCRGRRAIRWCGCCGCRSARSRCARRAGWWRATPRSSKDALTGSGRPSGALRAAVLRRWAQRGRLPSYAALSGDSRRYLGNAMAYLGGSAFLEWLEARAGQGAAGAHSSDRAASTGCGGGCRRARCAASTTPSAASSASRRRRCGTASAPSSPGRRSRSRSGSPGRGARASPGSTVRGAPDGRRSRATARGWCWRFPSATSRRGSRSTRRPTTPRPRAAARRSGAGCSSAIPRTRRRSRAARRRASRSPRWSSSATTVDPSPRFLADGSVLFARSLPDRDGRFRADLFRWRPGRPEGGEVERVTRGADVRAADPAPDGSWAVALQSQWGQTRLVRVDLATGEVTPLTEWSVDDDRGCAAGLARRRRGWRSSRHRGDGLGAGGARARERRRARRRNAARRGGAGPGVVARRRRDLRGRGAGRAARRAAAAR